MKVFISGPMSGKPNGNKEVFFRAEYKLKGLGYSVFNPAWFRYGTVTEFTPDDMHMIDFSALSRCDAIYMLKGWQYSIGARAEFEHAKELGKAILREGDPITDPLKYGKYDWESWKNKLPDSLDSKKNTPVFDQEFAYDEAIKNRTNYQLEAIKENIKEKYSDVNQAINDVEADLDNFKDETDGKMDDIYDTLHRHGENLDSCQYDIRSLGRRLNNNYADSANKIYSLKKEVEAIKESIGTDNLQEQLEKDFADVYEEFQNTKDKVADIEFGYIDWSSKMSSAIDEMEKVKETVKGLNSLVATLGEQNGVLSDKIEIGIEENRHYRLSITEQLGTIRSRLKAIDNLENTNEVHWINIQGLDKKLDELIHNVAELEKDQVDINSKVAKKLDDYKEAYKHLDNADDALERRIKAIEKRLSIKPFYAPTEDEKDD